MGNGLVRQIGDQSNEKWSQLGDECARSLRCTRALLVGRAYAHKKSSKNMSLSHGLWHVTGLLWQSSHSYELYSVEISLLYSRHCIPDITYLSCDDLVRFTFPLDSHGPRGVVEVSLEELLHPFLGQLLKQIQHHPSQALFHHWHRVIPTSKATIVYYYIIRVY